MINSNNILTTCLGVVIILILYNLFKNSCVNINDSSNIHNTFVNRESFMNSLSLKEGFQSGSLTNNIKNHTTNHYPKNDIFNKKKEIHYLYWTGGYDSTFRLCEMLIDEGKIVQPYYVTLILDNDCQTEESCNKLWLRRNRKEEKEAIKKIVASIKSKFPHVAPNLMPVIYIDNPINNDSFNYKYDLMFDKIDLWPKKRKRHQYLFLSKYPYYHKRNIDIGVLGIHEKSKFAKFLKTNLVKTADNFEIKNKKHPLGYLRFPLYGRTKEDLLYKSQMSGYDDILKITWSCWFPKSGSPCGKCPMCKERIVEHPK